jgi:hypothetical protein
MHQSKRRGAVGAVKSLGMFRELAVSVRRINAVATHLAHVSAGRRALLCTAEAAGYASCMILKMPLMV